MILRPASSTRRECCQCISNISVEKLVQTVTAMAIKRNVIHAEQIFKVACVPPDGSGSERIQQ
jgi:hypothetical protein